MRRFSAPRRAALAILAAGALAVSMIACGGSATPNPLTPTIANITTLPSNDEMLAEKTLGPASAPNTIIEYVSFADTRPGGSKDFYLTGDGVQIKSQLADTGKAQILFRNLFFQGEPPSAAALARCAGNAKFFNAVTTIFQNQAVWVNSSNPDTDVQRVMLGFGMSQGVISACVNDQTLLGGLNQLANAAIASNYLMPDGTQRTPSATTGGSIFDVPALVVNGVIFDGHNNDQTVNAAFAPTLANIQAALKAQ